MGSLILHRMKNFTDFVFLLNLIKTPNTECGENLNRSLSLCCVGRLNRIEREGPCLPWAMTWLDMTWQDQLLFQPCHCVHQPMPNIYKSYPLKWENMKIWQNYMRACAYAKNKNIFISTWDFTCYNSLESSPRMSPKFLSFYGMSNQPTIFCGKKNAQISAHQI